MDNNNSNTRKFYTVTPILLLVLMIVVSTVGIYIFRVQYDKNNLKEDTGEYRKYGKYYAMITSDDRADFWQSIYNGAKAAGESKDAYVELFASNIGTGYTKEQRLEIAIASGVDGIILEGEDDVVLKRTMTRAIESGIPVVTVTQDITDSERISFVGISRYDLGQTYGKEAVKLAHQMIDENVSLYNEKTPLKVVVLIDKENDNAGQNILLSGIKEEIVRDPSLANRVQIDTYAVDNSGAFTAEESIRDIFMGEVSVPDILIGLSEIHTNCAYQAVIDYNRVGRTNIIGYYDSSTILNAVKKEIIFSTISMDTAQMGRYCAEALTDYLDEGYVSDYYAVDTYVVGQDNINEYLKD